VNARLQPLADFLGLTTSVVVAIGLVVITLAAGSVLRIASVRGMEPAKRRDRLGSLVVWWVGLAIVIVIASVGVSAGILVFGLLSCLGLREYFRLVDHLVSDATGRLLVYVTALYSYVAVWLNNDLLFSISVPVVGFMLLAASLVAAGKTKGYLLAVGSLAWGAILLGYFLSHSVRLLTLPASSNPIGGNAGWFIFLVVLTESDDIFQALWGRRFGKHKITPEISPKKSLEGLVGGFLSTVAIGIAIAPGLTPLAKPWVLNWQGREWHIPYAGAVAACLLVSVAGFLGDLNMSALKRDAGVKDTGDLLPGQGGVLDRIDSLLFTAPAFYYFVRLLYT
jgi:phosphatidate cytidylyltransferase